MINQAGIDLIKSFEGLHKVRPDGRIEAYLDPVGVVTIGYGTTRIDGKPVKLGDVISKAGAEELLLNDITRFETEVARLVTVKLNENQLAALVSLAYNIGVNAFAGSTLLSLLNTGDYKSAAAQFTRWNKGTVNGVLTELPGLTRRRQAERDLFLKPVNSAENKVTQRPYAPAPVPLDISLPLRLRDLGIDVYKLQCALIGLGYLAKPKEGEAVGDVFNEHVEYAVMRFQRDYELLADGVVGKLTKEAMEKALTRVRELLIEHDEKSDVAVLKARDGYYQSARWANLKSLVLTIGNEQFLVASGQPFRQTFRKAQDKNSVPGSMEPIPQGTYTFYGEPEFVNGEDNYSGSWGEGLGPVWHGLRNGQSMRRGSFGLHVDPPGAPGSAGCIVFFNIDDLKRYVRAWRKFKPKTLVVDWKLS